MKRKRGKIPVSKNPVLKEKPILYNPWEGGTAKVHKMLKYPTV